MISPTSSLTGTSTIPVDVYLTVGAKTPYPYQTAGGTITVEFIQNLKNQHTYSLSASPPSLTPTTLSAPTIACTAYVAKSGSSGNLECVLTASLTSVYSIAALRVTLPTSSQYTTIYPFCQATIGTGSTTMSKKLLSCSRQETSSASAVFLITGFNFVTGSTVLVRFRARALTSTTLTANVALQTLYNGAYYTTDLSADASLPITAVLDTTCKSPYILNFLTL